MRYFCLCLNPAVDATVVLPRAPTGDGEIFKDLTDAANAGGKALNVARWLALRGERVACGGLLGADNAILFERVMATCGIEDRFLRVPGETRRNEMLVWPGGSAKLNRVGFPGLEVPPPERMLAKLSADEVLVLSGSLPAECPSDYYARCISHARSLGVRAVLDASGEALRLAVAAGTWLVKPNTDECAAAVGFVPRAPDDFRRATDLLHRTCTHVIISDGAAGAWFDGVFVPAPAVEVVDTTSAGDTLLAEYCHSGDPRLAVAAGSAACTEPGSRPAEKAFRRIAFSSDI